MWFNLAASKGDKKAGALLERLSKGMSQEQIADAQRLSREWKPAKTKIPKSAE